MMSMLRVRTRLASAGFVSLALAGLSAAAPPAAIRAGGYVTPQGEIKSGGATVAIRDGRISNISSEANSGSDVDFYEGAVICPGLIDCLSSLTADGQLVTTADAVSTGVMAVDALDRHHPQLRAALESGVTTFLLAAGDYAIVGGNCAIASTSAAGPSERGPVKLSLSPLAFLPNREPTSRGGALALIRAALSQEPARGDRNRDARPVRSNDEARRTATLRELLAGKEGSIVAAPSAADVLSFIELAREYKFTPTLIHNDDARDVAAAIAAARLGVVAGPYRFGSSPRETQAAGILEKAGLRVALGGGLPYLSSDSLRVSAAIAVQSGMSPAAARRAITSTAAELIGAADRVGSIEPGRRADIVVFSGDPLDLRSRVLAVYVGGSCVWRAPSEKEAP